MNERERRSYRRDPTDYDGWWEVEEVIGKPAGRWWKRRSKHSIILRVRHPGDNHVEVHEVAVGWTRDTPGHWKIAAAEYVTDKLGKGNQAGWFYILRSALRRQTRANIAWSECGEIAAEIESIIRPGRWMPGATRDVS